VDTRVARSTTWITRIGRIAAVSFGAWIAITSAVGIALGVHSGEGWLAILYGSLGMSMGAAGMAGVWMSGAPRGALLGWFLVGIASRALVEGDLYLVFISAPIAVALLATLAFELLHRPSVSGTLGAAAGGGLAVLSLIALAIAAPSLPVICQPFPAPGTSSWSIAYPGNTPPFDVAEQNYADRCSIQFLHQQ
jgi:hypothetical protein